MHCDFWILGLGVLAIAGPAVMALRLGSFRRLNRSVPAAGVVAPGVSFERVPCLPVAGGWVEKAFAARDRALLADLEGRLSRGARLCDVGCGEGRLLRKLKEAGFEVYGIDIDIEQVAAARASIGADRVRHGELTGAWTGPGDFEAILFCDSIRYISRPHEILDHALRMASYVVITEPFALWHFLGRLLSMRFLHQAGHLTRIDPRALPVVALRKTLFHRLWILEGWGEETTLPALEAEIARETGWIQRTLMHPALDRSLGAIILWNTFLSATATSALVWFLWRCWRPAT
jgi:SAM-dependent methyltransferase